MQMREKHMTYKQIADVYGTTDKYIKKIIHQYRHPPPKAEPKPGVNINYDPNHPAIVEAREQAQREIMSVAAADGRLPITGSTKSIMKAVGKIGDDKVGAFIAYHVEMFKMRQGVDKKNVPDLYRRFLEYLNYCQEHNIVPGNMSCYFAIGVDESDMSMWRKGARGTPEHQKFAEDVAAFFRSIHEQGAVDGILNPISSMFWQKAHDGMIEASKLEQKNVDPLGDKQSAEDIARKYEGVELPE